MIAARKVRTHHIIASLCVIGFVAMILPLFLQDNRSRHSPALSLVKVSALAISIYSTEFDDRLPRADQWTDLAWKYLNTSPPHTVKYQGQSVSSAMNALMDSQNYPTESNVVVLMFTAPGERKNLFGGPIDAYVLPGENRISFVAFCDTHARTYPAKEIAKLRWQP